MEDLFRIRADRRRKDRATRKTYDPIALNQRHQEILNMHVAGMKESQICETLDVTPATVSNTINSTLGQQKISMLRGARDADTLDAVARIKELLPKALDVYEKILSDEESLNGLAHAGASINLQKATADTIVKDLSGLAAPKKVLVGHAHITPELIEEFKAQGRKAAEECGLIVVNQ